MPSSAPSPCRAIGCAAVVHRGGYCDKHTSARPKPKRKEGYTDRFTWTWRKVSRQVRLEEPFCRVCGRVSEQVDHIIPVTEGGDNDRENLQALCTSCHSKKTRRENSRRHDSSTATHKQ